MHTPSARDPLPSPSKSPAARPGPNLVRWGVRCTVLALAPVLLGPLAGSGHVPRWIPGASALVALGALLAMHPAGWVTLVGLVPAGVAVFKGRWFCRWLCPLGTCAEVVSRASARLGCRCPRIMPLGQWLALATLAGAALGWPMFVWLDPLAIFASGAGAFALTGTRLGYAAAVLALLVLGASVLFPGLWCGRLCPLGGLQDLLAAAPRWRPGRPAGQGQGSALRPLARRAVLGGVLGLVGAAVLRRTASQAAPPLRPPGAVPEALFGGLCVRCGNCVRACPTGILLPATTGVPVLWLLTPVIRFGENYCQEACVRCTEVCPSGALAPLTPQTKARAPVGLAEVDVALCLRAHDQECASCRARCPYEAIAFVFSEEEYVSVPRVDPARCPGCGACEVACPTAPTKAIVVRPLAPGRRKSLGTRREG